jgi:hypothetical protein
VSAPDSEELLAVRFAEAQWETNREAEIEYHAPLMKRLGLVTEDELLHLVGGDETARAEFRKHMQPATFGWRWNGDVVVYRIDDVLKYLFVPL